MDSNLIALLVICGWEIVWVSNDKRMIRCKHITGKTKYFEVGI